MVKAGLCRQGVMVKVGLCRLMTGGNGEGGAM